MLNIYRHSLSWVLDNSGLMLVVLLLTIALNVVLIIKIPRASSPNRTRGPWWAACKDRRTLRSA
jgi:multidrug efflux pump